MESVKYCLDTDILIDYLHGKEEARDFLKREYIFYSISTIVVVEIYSGEEMKMGKKRRHVEEFLENFHIIPVSKQIAQKAGDLRRSYRLPFADMIVASTAIENGLPLITRNTKHYKGVTGLILIKPY